MSLITNKRKEHKMTAYAQIKKHEEYKKLCIASYRPYKKLVSFNCAKSFFWQSKKL